MDSIILGWMQCSASFGVMLCHYCYTYLVSTSCNLNYEKGTFLFQDQISWSFRLGLLGQVVFFSQLMLHLPLGYLPIAQWFCNSILRELCHTCAAIILFLLIKYVLRFPEKKSLALSSSLIGAARYPLPSPSVAKSKNEQTDKCMYILCMYGGQALYVYISFFHRSDRKAM